MEKKHRISRSLLRSAAASILQRRLGYRVDAAVAGQGVARGARLVATKDSETVQVAVRSSEARRIRGVRRQTGCWKTFPEVDLVVVAVPARFERHDIEIIGFDPQTIIQSLDAALRRMARDAPFDEPILVALDDKVRGDTRQPEPGLISKAKWRHVLAINDPLLKDAAKTSSPAGFIERVKREFADLNGVDAAKVSVEFKIID